MAAPARGQWEGAPEAHTAQSGYNWQQQQMRKQAPRPRAKCPTDASYGMEPTTVEKGLEW